MPETVTIANEDKKGIAYPRDVLIPSDQEWLWHMLFEQTKILKKINTAVQIIAVIILLSVIVAACSAILS
jgi:uncharacterized protein YmfQ (DUF2313 family)